MPDLTISVTLTPTEPNPPRGYRIVGYGIQALCNVEQVTLKQTASHASKRLQHTTQLVCYVMDGANEVMAGEWDQNAGGWSWKTLDSLSNPSTEHM